MNEEIHRNSSDDKLASVHVGDPKPAAAYRLGFYSRLPALDSPSPEVLQELLSVLFDEIEPKAYTGLQTVIVQLSADRRDHEHKHGLRAVGGWVDDWQPEAKCLRPLSQYADRAIRPANQYRKWYDLGVVLGEWAWRLRQGREDNLDMDALQQACRLIPDKRIKQIDILKKLAKRRSRGSTLEGYLRRVLGDEEFTVIEPENTPALSAPTTEFRRIEEHTVRVSVAYQLATRIASRIAAGLQGLPTPAKNSSWEQHPDRDKWIYEHIMKGIPYKQIEAELKNKANLLRWRRISGVNSIKAAAVRFATRHELPLPPSRQPGRPKKRT
jgi:hypothetical protein